MDLFFVHFGRVLQVFEPFGFDPLVGGVRNDFKLKKKRSRSVLWGGREEER